MPSVASGLKRELSERPERQKRSRTTPPPLPPENENHPFPGMSESRMRLLPVRRRARTAWLSGSDVPEVRKMLTDRSPGRSPRTASRCPPKRRRLRSELRPGRTSQRSPTTNAPASSDATPIPGVARLCKQGAEIHNSSGDSDRRLVASERDSASHIGDRRQIGERMIEDDPGPGPAELERTVAIHRDQRGA
jgi:hypothetical protein